MGRSKIFLMVDYLLESLFLETNRRRPCSHDQPCEADFETDENLTLSLEQFQLLAFCVFLVLAVTWVRCTDRLKPRIQQSDEVMPHWPARMCNIPLSNVDSTSTLRTRSMSSKIRENVFPLLHNFPFGVWSRPQETTTCCLESGKKDSSTRTTVDTGGLVPEPGDHRPQQLSRLVRGDSLIDNCQTESTLVESLAKPGCGIKDDLYSWVEHYCDIEEDVDLWVEPHFDSQDGTEPWAEPHSDWQDGIEPWVEPHSDWKDGIEPRVVPNYDWQDGIESWVEPNRGIRDDRDTWVQHHEYETSEKSPGNAPVRGSAVSRISTDINPVSGSSKKNQSLTYEMNKHSLGKRLRLIKERMPKEFCNVNSDEAVSDLLQGDLSSIVNKYYKEVSTDIQECEGRSVRVQTGKRMAPSFDHTRTGDVPVQASVTCKTLSVNITPVATPESGKRLLARYNCPTCQKRKEIRKEKKDTARALKQSWIQKKRKQQSSISMVSSKSSRLALRGEELTGPEKSFKQRLPITVTKIDAPRRKRQINRKTPDQLHRKKQVDRAVGFVKSGQQNILSSQGQLLSRLPVSTRKEDYVNVENQTIQGQLLSRLPVSSRKEDYVNVESQTSQGQLLSRLAVSSKIEDYLKAESQRSQGQLLSRLPVSSRKEDYVNVESQTSQGQLLNRFPVSSKREDYVKVESQPQTSQGQLLSRLSGSSKTGDYVKVESQTSYSSNDYQEQTLPTIFPTSSTEAVINSVPHSEAFPSSSSKHSSISDAVCGVSSSKETLAEFEDLYSKPSQIYADKRNNITRDRVLRSCKSSRASGTWRMSTMSSGESKTAFLGRALNGAEMSVSTLAPRTVFSRGRIQCLGTSKIQLPGGSKIQCSRPRGGREPYTREAENIITGASTKLIALKEDICSTSHANSTEEQTSMKLPQFRQQPQQKAGSIFQFRNFHCPYVSNFEFKHRVNGGEPFACMNHALQKDTVVTESSNYDTDKQSVFSQGDVTSWASMNIQSRGNLERNVIDDCQRTANKLTVNRFKPISGNPLDQGVQQTLASQGWKELVSASLSRKLDNKKQSNQLNQDEFCSTRFEDDEVEPNVGRSVQKQDLVSAARKSYPNGSPAEKDTLNKGTHLEADPQRKVQKNKTPRQELLSEWSKTVRSTAGHRRKSLIPRHINTLCKISRTQQVTKENVPHRESSVGSKVNTMASHISRHLRDKNTRRSAGTEHRPVAEKLNEKHKERNLVSEAIKSANRNQFEASTGNNQTQKRIERRGKQSLSLTRAKTTNSPAVPRSSDAVSIGGTHRWAGSVVKHVQDRYKPVTKCSGMKDLGSAMINPGSVTRGPKLYVLPPELKKRTNAKSIATTKSKDEYTQSKQAVVNDEPKSTKLANKERGDFRGGDKDSENEHNIDKESSYSKERNDSDKEIHTDIEDEDHAQADIFNSNSASEEISLLTLTTLNYRLMSNSPIPQRTNEEYTQKGSSCETDKSRQGNTLNCGTFETYSREQTTVSPIKEVGTKSAFKSIGGKRSRSGRITQSEATSAHRLQSKITLKSFKSAIDNAAEGSQTEQSVDLTDDNSRRAKVQGLTRKTKSTCRTSQTEAISRRRFPSAHSFKPLKLGLGKAGESFHTEGSTDLGDLNIQGARTVQSVHTTMSRTDSTYSSTTKRVPLKHGLKPACKGISGARCQTVRSEHSRTRCQTVRSENTGTRCQTVRSENTGTRCQTVRSENSGARSQTVRSENTGARCQTVGSEHSRTRCQTVGSEHTGARCQTVKSENTGTRCQTVRSENTRERCQTVRSENTRARCQTVRSEHTVAKNVHNSGRKLYSQLDCNKSNKIDRITDESSWKVVPISEVEDDGSCCRGGITQKQAGILRRYTRGGRCFEPPSNQSCKLMSTFSTPNQIENSPLHPPSGLCTNREKKRTIFFENPRFNQVLPNVELTHMDELTNLYTRSNLLPNYVNATGSEHVIPCHPNLILPSCISQLNNTGLCQPQINKKIPETKARSQLVREISRRTGCASTKYNDNQSRSDVNINDTILDSVAESRAGPKIKLSTRLYRNNSKLPISNRNDKCTKMKPLQRNGVNKAIEKQTQLKYTQDRYKRFHNILKKPPSRKLASNQVGIFGARTKYSSAKTANIEQIKAENKYPNAIFQTTNGGTQQPPEVRCKPIFRTTNHGTQYPPEVRWKPIFKTASVENCERPEVCITAAVRKRRLQNERLTSENKTSRLMKSQWLEAAGRPILAHNHPGGGKENAKVYSQSHHIQMEENKIEPKEFPESKVRLFTSLKSTSHDDVILNQYGTENNDNTRQAEGIQVLNSVSEWDTADVDCIMQHKEDITTFNTVLSHRGHGSRSEELQDREKTLPLSNNSPNKINVSGCQKNRLCSGSLRSSRSMSSAGSRKATCLVSPGRRSTCSMLKVNQPKAIPYTIAEVESGCTTWCRRARTPRDEVYSSDFVTKSSNECEIFHGNTHEKLFPYKQRHVEFMNATANSELSEKTLYKKSESFNIDKVKHPPASDTGLFLLPGCASTTSKDVVYGTSVCALRCNGNDEDNKSVMFFDGQHYPYYIREAIDQWCYENRSPGDICCFPASVMSSGGCSSGRPLKPDNSGNQKGEGLIQSTQTQVNLGMQKKGEVAVYFEGNQIANGKTNHLFSFHRNSDFTNTGIYSDDGNDLSPAMKENGPDKHHVSVGSEYFHHGSRNTKSTYHYSLSQDSDCKSLRRFSSNADSKSVHSSSKKKESKSHCRLMKDNNYHWKHLLFSNSGSHSGSQSQHIGPHLMNSPVLLNLQKSKSSPDARKSEIISAVNRKRKYLDQNGLPAKQDAGEFMPVERKGVTQTADLVQGDITRWAPPPVQQVSSNKLWHLPAHLSQQLQETDSGIQRQEFPKFPELERYTNSDSNSLCSHPRPFTSMSSNMPFSSTMTHRIQRRSNKHATQHHACRYNRCTQSKCETDIKKVSSKSLQLISKKSNTRIGYNNKAENGKYDLESYLESNKQTLGSRSPSHISCHQASVEDSSECTLGNPTSDAYAHRTATRLNQEDATITSEIASIENESTRVRRVSTIPSRSCFAEVGELQLQKMENR